MLTQLVSSQEVGARAAEMEAAATKMAGELAEYKAESKELHNQEHTIRRLEDKTRSLEAQLEDKVPCPCTCCTVRTLLRSESFCIQLSSLHSPPPSRSRYSISRELRCCTRLTVNSKCLLC